MSAGDARPLGPAARGAGPRAHRFARWLWPALGLATAATLAAAAACSRDLAADLRPHLALLLLAGLLWLASLALVAAGLGRGGRGAVGWLLVVALLLRLPAWREPPRHSDDVYRYLWDGAAQRRGLDPYAGPPIDPIYASLRAAGLLPRINNPHLPTIYPPAAQLAFRLGATLGGLPGWKIVVGAADLGVLLVLLCLCRRDGRDPRWAAAWGWSPLCALELGQNAHMDAIAILPLLLALWRWPRPGLAGAAWGAALLGKPLAAALLPAVLRLGRSARRRLLLGAVGAALLLLWPFRGAGVRLLGSLGEYGRRWRGNDGAFALLQGLADRAVALLYRPPYHEPWRLRTLARLVTGRPRDTVWPDELAAFLARGAAAAMLGALLLWLLRRPRPLQPARGALILIGAYLLLTPVLHPWYALWALCLCPLWPAAAPPWLVLAALVPLGYLPLSGWLAGAPWREPAWTRLLEHGAAWLSLGLALRAGGPLRRRSPFDGDGDTKYTESIA